MISEKNIKYIQSIIDYNPLTLIITLIRDGYIGKINIDILNFIYVFIILSILMITGILYFNKNRYKVVNYL